MNGPEHFRKAEELAAEAARVSPSFYPVGEYRDHVTGTKHADQLIGLAQVHATLALAAANMADAGPCTASVGPVLPGARPIYCNLRAGHAGMHHSESGTSWSIEDGAV